MQAKPQSARLDVRLFIAVLLFSVNLSAQQQVSQSSSQPAQPGVMIDPSAGPLKPSEPPPAATQPVESPSAQPPVPAQAQAPEQPAPQLPVGAAAAEQVKTAGGGASRPAGSAIAPVKQHQYRSILIKLGAAAAAGIAVGTVYGLSRATPSTPPHATTAAPR
jgi:hypothetical protein